MIRFQLKCSADHRFDGWFKSGADFDQQAEMGIIECPLCGGTEVHKAPMAPNVITNRATAPAPVENPTPADTAVPAPAVATPPPATEPPDVNKLYAMAAAFRAHVEKTFDNVGEDFADTARRIHAGDEPARGIYGETTPEEAEALEEEGVPVLPLPWKRQLT
ncbi:MAG: DUF1178 family protein [Magnetospiraceae bacterium]